VIAKAVADWHGAAVTLHDGQDGVGLVVLLTLASVARER
jgi:hypothetical protein